MSMCLIALSVVEEALHVHVQLTGAVVDRGTQILGGSETVTQPSSLCFRLMDSSNVPW